MQAQTDALRNEQAQPDASRDEQERELSPFKCMNPRCTNLISEQDGSAKKSNKSNTMKDIWICKKCKVDEIGSMEQDDISAEEYKVTDQVKHVVFVRREGQLIVKSDNLFDYLGIHDQAKQQQMEDSFYAYVRSIFKSIKEKMSDRSQSLLENSNQ